MERTDKIIEFLKEIEKMNLIEREIFNSDLKRKESDAEHSWHMAMFLMLFEKDLKEEADFSKIMKLILMHDLVEIYSGDTFAYDSEAKKTKNERESKAAEKLFSQLPEDLEKEFKELFEEYEKLETKESQIVKAIDKLQPILKNILTDGWSWKEFNIKYEDIDDYKRKHVEKNALMLKIYEKLMKTAKDKKLI